LENTAYNMMRMWQGAVGVVPTGGLVSPAYVVAKPRAGVFGGYFELLFRTDDCKNEINRNSRGIVSDRNRLCWDQFKRLDVPFPPLEEQREIVLHLANTKPLCTVTTCLEREIELHQFDVVRKLLADVVLNGAGKRYLIQHSAGSGKSNSIAWLAHQLIVLRKDEKIVFDSSRGFLSASSAVSSASAPSYFI
jgi:hypothetical protein